VKGEDVADCARALGTLRYVLRNLAKVIAPVMPFYAEYLFARVRTENDPLSVHLSEWPTPGPVDTTLIAHMIEVRRVVTGALEERTKAAIKVRQPLARLSYKSDVALSDDLIALIRDEVNVKEVVTTADVGMVLDTHITPELKREGQARELIRAVQDMRKQMDLEPKDRITLTIDTDDAGRAAIEAVPDFARVVGATEVVYGASEGTTVQVEGADFTVAVAKA
jgi:isoleucyl-tRNA synthetase